MKQISTIVEESIACSVTPAERKESIWLNEKYTDFMKQNGIHRKSEADRILCERAFGKEAVPSAEQKIRYWRSGKHLPNDRSVARRFGIALELSPEDIRYLMCSWMDIREVAFSENEYASELYRLQKKAMDQLIEEYVLKVCLRNRKEPLTEESVRSNLRHHYYMDARNMTALNHDELKDLPHFESVYYNSEFYRNMSLQGEIPRKTMLRHIFVLGQPYLSCEVVSDWLQRLGYCPLDETHHTASGDALDVLVIRLLQLYEKTCMGWSSEDASEWLVQTMQEMDRLLMEQGKESLRFMKFKSLK